MPRSGSGSYTLPSGNPVVTGTTIESNWANTTLSDIATTLTDSLSRSGQGGMTAALRVADGTQGAPGVGFANETSSGFYRAGTGEVWAVVQGAQTLNLDASGVYVPADKTTTVDGAFVFNEAGADKDARFEGDTDANLLFLDASTDRVGVGTNTPDAKLTVNGVGAFGDGAVGAPSIANTGDLNTGIWFPAADTVAVSTGGVEAARFDAAGNLGLGVTPSAWGASKFAMQLGARASLYGANNLTVLGNNYYDNGTNNVYIATAAASDYYQSAGTHVWRTAPSGTAGNAITFTQAMTLDASGNLMLGATSVPTSAIKLYTSDGTINAIQSYKTGGVEYIGTYSNHPLAILTNNAERARITSGGYFKASNSGTYASSTSTTFEFYKDTNDGNEIMLITAAQATAANQYGVGIRLAGDPNNASAYFMQGRGNATERFTLRSNGGLANYSANDVNLSDRREKTNFAPAKSYLDTICAIPVQTFNYIDQSDDDPGLTLGVVAQDVQAVAPELVMESNWGTADNPKMRLSIYQTDLQYALMKCVQELKAQNDDLRARVAALEAQP